MRKNVFMLFAMLLASSFSTHAKDIFVNTPSTTLLLKADEGQPLHISYYGERVGNADEVYRAYSIWKEAYPAYGRGNMGTDGQHISALSVKHADGNMSTELVYVADAVKDEANAKVYVITMRDKVYPFEVDVCYRAYTNCDVIETWSEIRNGEKKPITLLQYASGYLPLRQGDVWVSHQHGAWGNEAALTEEPLHEGLFQVKDLSGGKSGHYNRPNIMISLDGKPQENAGRVVGAVLKWPGNFSMTFDTEDRKLHHFVAGIHELNSSYTLKKGESFTTPELVLTYSTEGKGGASRNFHRWARRNNQIHNGTALRKILLNSWEGVYLNVSQKGMEEMMDGVRDLGGELFVMDDGWFGAKYRRTIDDRGLGDWVTDTVKLPKGVPALEKAATERGLKWGIWIEPEMVNTKSELYEKHPDWVVCHPAREPQPGRGGTQLLLDMSNPAVQDYVFSIVDNIMKETPNTYYIKWDYNYEIKNHGSHYLTSDNQSHLLVDYFLGVLKTVKRIRQAYPDLVIQCCSSGGARANYGLMPYFDEMWVSDNTDAQQRLFMQWGTSMFFPVCAMAQHVSASPNHQTQRVIPIKFRFDVAMTGRLGMEMKPSDLNPKEFEFAKKAFQTYKEIRPIVQQGDQYRLISPYDGRGYASEMFVTEDKSEAVFFAYKFEQYVDMFRPRFRFAGLDPDATYQLTEINREGGADHWEGARISGRFLMQQGIEVRLDTPLFASRVIKLKKI